MQLENKKRRPRIMSEILEASSDDYKYIKVHCWEKDDKTGKIKIWID